MVNWSEQRYWEDVREGDLLAATDFPLNVHRLVAEAGANKDFANIHHNTEVAQSTGAPEMYANNIFLQGMWERVVREYIGVGGMIRKIGPLRMLSFNTAGDTVRVRGKVTRKWREDSGCYVELEMSSDTSRGRSVSGSVTVVMPSRES